MKNLRSISALLFLILFMMPCPAHAVSAASSPVHIEQSFSSKAENRKGNKMKKKRLHRTFQKVKAWLGKVDERKGDKYGLIALGLAGLSVVLLFTISLGAMYLFVTLSSIAFALLSFYKKEKREPAIYALIIALVPAAFLLTVFIALSL